MIRIFSSFDSSPSALERQVNELIQGASGDAEVSVLQVQRKTPDGFILNGYDVVVQYTGEVDLPPPEFPEQGNLPYKLAETEYLLLKRVWEGGNTPVSFDEMQEVLGDGTTTVAVRSLIGRIQTKQRKSGNSWYRLENVRGKGYIIPR
ncbi:zeta toxin family protein [Candidatus Woesearchaeota archaeon]|nr:zeta toxin family protein [Candidatus Woesearchaeota archaeon]